MDINRFNAILTTFADPGTSAEVSKGNVLVQINDKTLLARVRLQDGDLWVDDESGETMLASRWLIQRVAKLSLLADRILQFLRPTPQFVHPEGHLLDSLEEDNTVASGFVSNALDCATKLLSRRLAFTTSVVYLTSDAGEGKTTLIRELAIQQAQAYKDRKTDWLLVPIELGGRPFMRFDDVIAGYLANKLRFPHFYYEAFIELVKLGVIIPAFDGFEETLVVNASGDAYSAIGNLMASLDQQGTVMISARKAFFEYQELKLQAKLYDSIGNKSVAFSRLQLCRWKRDQFIRYASLRNHPTPEELFNAVAAALHSDEHALLTRAVLANRLLTVANGESNLGGLLEKLGASPNDYFPVFVDALIEREVIKWLVAGDEAAQPPLSLQEHRELLSMIAQEMWIQATETLKSEILELIASLFCDSHGKSSAITHQVQQRIKQHALIVPIAPFKDQFGFDHEEFRHYFLGLALASLISGPDPTRNNDLSASLRRGPLPAQVLEATRSALKSQKPDLMRTNIEVLRKISTFDSATSYLHENCVQLILRLLSHREMGPIELEAMSFGAESLEAVSFNDITFLRCVFRSTATNASSFTHCKFVKCQFDRLDLSTTPELKVSDSEFRECNFGSIVPLGKETAVFDPVMFTNVLRAAGFTLQDTASNVKATNQATDRQDDEFVIIEKLFRQFSNRTHITDLLIKVKFGKLASYVLDQLVPNLIHLGVVYEDTYHGRGKHRLFKLRIGMERLHAELERSKGDSKAFLKSVAN